MDVLLTGAGGKVGTAVLEHVDESEFTIHPLDVEPLPDRDTVVADVADEAAMRRAVEGMDAVVHLARPDGPGYQDDSLAWGPDHAANLAALNHVTAACVDAGVDSLVLASSNHAMGLQEVRHAPAIYARDADRDLRIDHDEPHRPDSRYGLVKTYGEDLGRLAAETSDLRFYALRIGTVLWPEYDHPYGLAERGVDNGRWERGSDAYEEQVARMKCLWQSRRDCAHLVACCLRDDTVEWDHFYGVSANERRWLDDLEHARETVGYEPRDAAEEWDGPPADGGGA